MLWWYWPTPRRPSVLRGNPLAPTTPDLQVHMLDAMARFGSLSSSALDACFDGLQQEGVLVGGRGMRSCTSPRWAWWAGVLQQGL